MIPAVVDFTVADVYPYCCVMHPMAMLGVVYVEAP
jgi:plastocyanin